MKKNDVIITEQKFDVPVETVWKAITNVNQMRDWFFDNIPEFKAEIGFKTQFMVETEERKFLHLWEIIEVTPNKQIKYNWRYQDYDGEAFVSFELTEDKLKSSLKLTCEVIESFDDNIPEFQLESCQAGWNYFINQQLKEYLES